MKKLYTFPLVLLVAITFLACEDLADVTFTTDYSAVIEADVPASVKSGDEITATFSVSDQIDPNSDEDFEKYSEKIKDIDITDIKGIFLETSKTVMLDHAVVRVVYGGYEASWTFQNLEVTMGKELDLGDYTDNWTTVENILNEKEEFSVWLEGETNEDDFQMKLEVTIESEVTANPL